MHFEWDSSKEASNVRKHGISFDEAKAVFTDELARLIADPDHSEDKDQFILLGTIRLDEDTIAYFKGLAEDKGVPYQSLINLYLRDCAQSHKDLTIKWQ
ncbi:MAG: BrnT family toxin [Porticoccaceae bacterium]|nr:BrnT family toxin [Porticoccaceae bacterium]